MTFLRTFREKHKREVRILIIFFSSLVIFTLMANSDTPIILRLIGFQLIYGIGVGFLFFRASVKTLLLALAFHITLFILDLSGALVLDGVFRIILERTKIDSSLILLYCTLFASIALVFISLLKFLKWSMKHLNFGARRQKDELKIDIVDSEGNSIYHEPVRDYLEGNMRRVSIEVYNSNSPGSGFLHIVGLLIFIKKRQVFYLNVLVEERKLTEFTRKAYIS